LPGLAVLLRLLLLTLELLQQLLGCLGRGLPLVLLVGSLLGGRLLVSGFGIVPVL
jgi:hypothetical protein